ncbi:MAG: TrkH family potassium uptake protein, partial [Muribaculaceae bacterium]|nr:TrkH family potassium uptake protein [Muribaculaceae bacterium]
IMLMLCGACAGSTSGGIKVDRLIVMARNLVNEIKKTVFPKRTYVVNLNGSFLQSSLVTRVSAFVTIYMTIVAVATAIITLFGYTFTDSLFMVSSCIGCNGLGYGATGIEGSYAFLPDTVKWLLVFLMLVGRLELFTFMVLLLTAFWKR